MSEDPKWIEGSGLLHWEVYDSGVYLKLYEKLHKVVNVNLMANGTQDICYANVNGQLLIKKIVDVEKKDIVHIPSQDIAIFEFKHILPTPICGKYLMLEIDEQFEPFVRHIVNRFPTAHKGKDWEMYDGKDYARR